MCDAFSVPVLIGYVLVEQYTIVRIGLYTRTLYILQRNEKKVNAVYEISQNNKIPDTEKRLI